jgi:hypothetical protein
MIKRFISFLFAIALLIFAYNSFSAQAVKGSKPSTSPSQGTGQQVEARLPFAKISVSTNHMVIMSYDFKTGGLAWGLGLNKGLALGGSDDPNFYLDKPMFLSSDVADVYAGEGFTLILKNNGSIYYLGTAPGLPPTSIMAKVPAINNAFAISYNLVLSDAGDVYRWGRVPGSGKTINYFVSHVKGLEDINAIAPALVSTIPSLALDSNGRVWSFKYSTYSKTYYTKLVSPDPGNSDRADDIASGFYRSFFLRNGKVYTVDSTFKIEPLSFPQNTPLTIIKIGSSDRSFMAQDNQGNFWTMRSDRSNNYCQLGVGDTSPHDAMVKATVIGKDAEIQVMKFSVGPQATVVVSKDNKLYRWGKNFKDNTYSCELVPIPITQDLFSIPQKQKPLSNTQSSPTEINPLRPIPKVLQPKQPPPEIK